MEHYVTLFDSVFLPQGLALHQSMERHAGAYTLWVLCMDLEAYNALKTLELPNVRPLLAERLETPELKAVKPTRSRAEYCWTITPFASRFVFEADSSVKRVTYIDADIWFLKSPKPIFDEFDASGKYVLITEHAYAPENDDSATFGQYCVQFIIFNRHEGEVVRKWWEDRCIEWCYARVEDGKFGDQKYLDDWPYSFEDRVHVMQQRHLAQGPWNATRYPYYQAVFFHFHGLRIISRDRLYLANYPLPSKLIRYVYDPYIIDFSQGVLKLRSINIKVGRQKEKLNIIKSTYLILLTIYRQLWRFHNLNYRSY
jgi:hypothetical protein